MASSAHLVVISPELEKAYGAKFGIRITALVTGANFLCRQCGSPGLLSGDRGIWRPFAALGVEGAGVHFVGRTVPELETPGGCRPGGIRAESQGFLFPMRLIGSGLVEMALRKEIAEKGLADCVHLPGPMPPEQVRDHMEKIRIFLFPGDYRELWENRRLTQEFFVAKISITVD